MADPDETRKPSETEDEDKATAPVDGSEPQDGEDSAESDVARDEDSPDRAEHPEAYEPDASAAMQEADPDDGDADDPDSDERPDAEAEDAQEADTETADAEAGSDTSTRPWGGGEDTPSEDRDDDADPDAAPVAEAAGVAAGAAAGAAAAASAMPREEEQSSREARPQPATREVVVRKGGFWSMLFGGVAAAALGFGAAQFIDPEALGLPGRGDPDIEAALAAQSDRIEELRQQLSALSDDAPDLSSLDARLEETAGAVSGMQSDLTRLSDEVETLSSSAGRVDEIAARLGDIEARLAEVEKRPATENVEASVIEAYERELQALQDSVAAQRAEVERMVEEATAREADAAEAARRAEAVSALARIVSAMDAGQPYGAALDPLSDALDEPVPEALSAAADDGVASLAALQDSFPDAARAALAAARDAEAPPDDVGGRLMSFLRDELGARSTTARDGDDADAVLSRAEAAVRAGELAAALEELAALPEPAQAEMAAWEASARARVAATTAADALAQRLNEE